MGGTRPQMRIWAGRRQIRGGRSVSRQEDGTSGDFELGHFLQPRFGRNPFFASPLPSRQEPIPGLSKKRERSGEFLRSHPTFFRAKAGS
jgi:hypothetical protein